MFVLSKLFFENNYTKQTTFPYYIEDDGIDELITNPQVKKTLRKAIKVINAIIKQYQNQLAFRLLSIMFLLEPE